MFIFRGFSKGSFLSAASQVRMVGKQMVLHQIYLAFWEVYSELYIQYSETSKMKHFPNIVNSWMPLPVFTKVTILGVWLGSKYGFDYPGLFFYYYQYRQGKGKLIFPGNI